MGQMIFVIGPESSGTRLMTKLFIKLGYEGEDTHKQKLDSIKLNESLDSSKDIVFRRSIPHGGIIPNIIALHEYFKSQKFDIYTIITHRDFLANTFSKVANKHSEQENVRQDILDQWIYIGNCLQELEPFIIVSTSQLFARPKPTLANLFFYMNLEEPIKKAKKLSPIIYDADFKRMIDIF
ncbi:MAG: hypothetical protein ACOCP4_05595 [Candidatus Woesearchaeota archaeon]